MASMFNTLKSANKTFILPSRRNITNISKMSEKPIVLRLGEVEFAHSAWSEFEKIANVISVDSTNREEFIKDLQTKYSKAVAITRTFGSVKQTGRFDEELVSHFPPTLKAIAHNGAGYDQIDIEPLTKRGIQASNVPTLVDAPTADTHIFLLLSAMRHFQQGHDKLMNGEWVGQKAAGAALGHDPKGKVLGIFGMGGIGRAVHDRAIPFGFEKIIYHNRSRLSPELENGAEYVSFDELLATSDVISINIPLNPNTRHSINKEAFAKMKTGVVIINTARGAVIDEAALIDAVKSGKVGSCGLDVFEFEPKVPKELLEFPNVVTVPHMGTHTYETIQSMEEFVIKNIETFFKTGKIVSIVPEQKEINFKVSPII